MEDLSKIYHYLQLTDLLLTSGQPTEAQLAAVAASGAKTVINLALPNSTHALADESRIVAGLGMGYLHIPVAWERPTRADLVAFMDAMDAHQGEKVLVHCAANMRVSAFVALYRILRQGWSRARAFSDLHRIWDPDEEPIWQRFMTEALAGTDGGD